MSVRLQALELRDRITDDLGYRNLFIHEAIDERGVRAILEKTPYQVGEQVLVFSNRSIHAHAGEIRDLPRGLGIQQPAHAVQPLKLKVRVRGRELQHRGNAVRVVRRELRVDQITVLKEASHTGQVRYIRGHLAGVYRIAVKTALLCSLDLRIPISAFYQ